MRITFACFVCGLLACASTAGDETETPETVLRPAQAPPRSVANQGAEIARLSGRCEAGDKGDCFLLSMAYQKGESPSYASAEIVAKDMRRAAHYAGKGCALGEMICCHNLAEQYRKGDGVSHNDEMAVQLHSKVCNGPLGVMTKFSCATLGDLLIRGVGVRPDFSTFKTGIAYLEYGCSLGSAVGCSLRDEYAGTGLVSERDPPKGAIGFTFGWSGNQARTACADLHGKWASKKKLATGSLSQCDARISAIGRDVTATLGFVDGRLAMITASYEPDQQNAITEYARVGRLLVESYGKPSKRESEELEGCGTQALGVCLARELAKFSMYWDFKDHQYQIWLFVRGNPDGTTSLILSYWGPDSGRLVGHLGL